MGINVRKTEFLRNYMDSWGIFFKKRKQEVGGKQGEKVEIIKD